MDAFSFWTLKRIRSYIGMRRRFDRHDWVDTLAEQYCDPDRPVERTTIRFTLLGFQTEAAGATGFAALKALRRDHPVVTHLIYTYFAVLASLITLCIVLIGPWSR
ncbi:MULTISPECIES: hypothetical protein [Streptomyces]|uniref:hypothetical protein n=1 Tax=Streptomyces TaxID=1883 RepID=UPI0004CD32A6|nr:MULTISPECIES: hypothetical protein [Streptomyces]KOT57944.1 hypothetical protein ADK43_19345 [Streptomyces rimosus subsp. rimosus]